jgi:transposase-like protein
MAHNSINNEEWMNIIPVYQKCPHCNTGYLDNRVKRGFIVKHLFIWMDVKRYQCNACGKKVYIKNRTQNTQLNF